MSGMSMRRIDAVLVCWVSRKVLQAIVNAIVALIDELE